MKKLIAILMAVLMLVSVCGGCGNSASETKQDSMSILFFRLKNPKARLPKQ